MNSVIQNQPCKKVSSGSGTFLVQIWKRKEQVGLDGDTGFSWLNGVRHKEFVGGVDVYDLTS
jgi:hypothetical protein